MSERIDHAAESQRLLRGTADVGPIPLTHVGALAGVATRNIATAQVHATLALVEQQRIANLIAVSQMEGGPYKDVNNWVVEVHDTDGRYVGDDDANPIIRDQIREGLGLS